MLRQSATVGGTNLAAGLVDRDYNIIAKAKRKTEDADSAEALCRDIVKLADILGHSSIDTTRIYLRTTGAEHVRQLERLHLLC